MNTGEILYGILRRWYIVVLGMALAVGGSLAVWAAIPPSYERAASLLLTPGDGMLPEGATNPYLYLGGLSTAADVLVRASSSEDVVDRILEPLPEAELTIVRDYSTSAPVVAVTSLAPTDAEAKEALDLAITSISATLEDLQDEQGVATAERISLQKLYVDTEGTLQQKTRIIAAAVTGVGAVLLSIFTAALVDGLVRRAKIDTRRSAPQARVVNRPEGMRDTRDDAALDPWAIDTPASMHDDLDSPLRVRR